MAYTTLTFHPHCGKDVQVTEGGITVERTGSWPLYGGALTARPLRTGEIFKIELNGCPQLHFGVTTHSPEELLEIPKSMHQLHGTWCLECEMEGWIYVNGEVVNTKFLSHATLKSLTKGDTLGLKVTNHRQLSYYMNGKEVGVAATDIPNKIYGFVDLWNDYCPAVKLIPDVQEPPDTLVNFNGPEKPPEKPVEHAKVILDYPAEQPEELSIKIGDIVEILGKDMKQDGWWEIRIREQTGMIPKTFVELLPTQQTAASPHQPPNPSISKPETPPPSNPHPPASKEPPEQEKKPALSLPVHPNTPEMATTALTFHSRCGRNVRVTEGGMKMERANLLSVWYCGALTARPLRMEEIFQIELNGHPRLDFGITTHRPEELMEIPMEMHKLQGTWCLDCGPDGLLWVNGEVIKRKFLSQAMKKGGILGLQVTNDRQLCFYVNGKRVGVAATDIPNTIYGFVDLYYSGCEAVKLIPDVHEKADVSPSTPLQEKEKEKSKKVDVSLPTPVQDKEKDKTKKVDVSVAALSTPTQEKDGKMEETKDRELEETDMLSTPLPTPVEKTELLTVREIPYSELQFGDIVGVGGQGAVFKGNWKTRSLSVAIKRVLGKIRHEEAELLSKLSHPNVITFYGVCTDKYPEYFIITEHAEGGSLCKLIHEKHYHPNFEESLQWAKEIAEGMRYLHQQKVIHRDLKSHNVLLTATRTIKLCDFGSAKEFDHTTTQTGTGTYRWIAPEVLKGVKVSLACDVFSYGMVLFELFKHEMPFAGIHDLKVSNMIIDGKTPAIPASLKLYLANLMKCCWQMNPKARPSFEEVLVILEKKECQEPVGESPRATGDATDGGPTDVRLTPKDLPHLQTVLEEASVVWYPLGMKLKLDSKTLLGIATASGNDTSTALNFVLTRWLKSKDQPPLLQSLTAALCSPEIGLTHLSDALLKNKNQF